jgi:3-oxoisoapionate decarboxylase
VELGISTYTYPWAIGVANNLTKQPLSMFSGQSPILQLLQIASAQNIKRVQVCDNLLEPLHQLSKEKWQEIKAVAETYNIQIEVGTRRLTVENLMQYLAIAQFFNAPFLRIVIDDTDYHPSISEVIEVINTVIGDFREANIVLAIENHDRFTVKNLIEIIEKTDKNQVAICLDTANSLGAGEGIKEVVEGLAPYTINLHVKDFTIKRVSYKMGFTVEGCAAGEGMLNVPYVLEQLAPYNRCISATLEVWSNPLSTLEASIENEAFLAEKGISYLKNIMK